MVLQEFPYYTSRKMSWLIGVSRKYGDILTCILKSSRPVSPDVTGRGLFPPLTAWFTCGATVFKHYCLNSRMVLKIHQSLSSVSWLNLKNSSLQENREDRVKTDVFQVKAVTRGQISY
jgi:hypothetical protein